MRVWFGSDNGLGVLSITAGAGIKQDPCRTTNLSDHSNLGLSEMDLFMFNFELRYYYINY